MQDTIDKIKNAEFGDKIKSALGRIVDAVKQKMQELKDTIEASRDGPR